MLQATKIVISRGNGSPVIFENVWFELKPNVSEAEMRHPAFRARPLSDYNDLVIYRPDTAGERIVFAQGSWAGFSYE